MTGGAATSAEHSDFGLQIIAPKSTPASFFGNTRLEVQALQKQGFNPATEITKKTTLCTIVNLPLVVLAWVGLILLARQVFGWMELWKLIVVTFIALPLAGYFVQYLISPIVNRIIGGKVAR